MAEKGMSSNSGMADMVLRKAGVSAELLVNTQDEILVVDDTVDSLRLLTEMLRQVGYQVRPAVKPRMALEYAFSELPKLILLDVKMPEMGGFEFCRRLKEDPRTADIPVIFVSALQDLRDRVRGFKVGGVDYIAKPLQQEEVLARVSRTLELERMRQQLTEMVAEKTHELVLDEQRFEALYELTQIRDGSGRDPVAFAMESALSMTKSEVAYLHFVSEDQQYVDFYHWSFSNSEQTAPNTGTRCLLEEVAIWDDCLRQGKLVIYNDCSGKEEKYRMPDGYFPCYRHMSVPIYEQGKVVAIIGVGNKRVPYDEADARQIALFGNGAWSIIQKQRSADQLHTALIQTVKSIANTVEQRDPYTAGHQRRVAELACAIAEEMEIDANTIEGLRMGGMIHDIGKVHIPAEILNCPRKLSKLEYELIKTHPKVGYDIIRDANFPWPVADIIYQHHERLDGSGYPQGVAGDAICIEARILAVADVVEAMATHRPYRPALSISAALEEIECGSSIKYDSKVVTACQRLFREKRYQLSPL
ncbi:MAG: response regulator [Candidatus Thiodiazotropha taylori]|nr:response regulator [Candidatus Thiodiazotropha taylori]